MKHQFKWIVSVELEDDNEKNIELAYERAKDAFFDTLSNYVSGWESLEEEDK